MLAFSLLDIWGLIVINLDNMDTCVSEWGKYQ